MKRSQKKHKSKVMERLENMSQEEMAQRWRDVRPRYIKMLSFFIVAALTLYCTYHFLMASGTTTFNITVVAFQIAGVFIVLFSMLTAMSFIYGRVPAKQST